MRTWSVNLSDLKALPGAGRVTVRAFDLTEAAEALLKALALDLTPCCELGDPPCASCERDAELRRQERMGDWELEESEEEIERQFDVRR